MSCSSASVGFWPSDLITVPNSFVVIVPSPSLSNKEKASLNSERQKDDRKSEANYYEQLDKRQILSWQATPICIYKTNVNHIISKWFMWYLFIVFSNYFLQCLLELIISNLKIHSTKDIGKSLKQNNDDRNMKCTKILFGNDPLTHNPCYCDIM